MDRDLQSIQEVRDLICAAKNAQRKLAQFSQQQIDEICAAIAKAGEENAQKLAQMAVEETGFGNVPDKVLKNRLGSTLTWEYCKDMKTVGIVNEDPVKGIMEVAVPVGVIAALIPSTNPTSTVLYKTIISIKAGNAIIISPHPGAKKAILETYKIIKEAAERAGAPVGTIGCISLTTVQATNELMRHKDTNLILATGGEAMVHAAYSSGTPAIGVGPGNGPSYIERSANIPLAVKRIFDSKTFDNGTICASEQSIVTEKIIEKEVEEEVRKQGGYFLTPAQSEKLSSFLLRANGTMNPQIVGKTAQAIAQMAGIEIPQGTRVLVSRQRDIGKKFPYSREKLCPILAFFVEDNWEKACETCIRILENEGSGHTMTIHSENKNVIREFALKKPVSRLLVNTPGALGGVGVTTNLAPALTLGCGAVGGSATSDNISPMNLLNFRRVAYGVKELEDIKGTSPCKAAVGSVQSTVCSAGSSAAKKFTPPISGVSHDDIRTSAGTNYSPSPAQGTSEDRVTDSDIEAIAKAVISRLGL